eukprot:6200450-Pleurochrysis_carterae.AAC.2
MSFLPVTCAVPMYTGLIHALSNDLPEQCQHLSACLIFRTYGEGCKPRRKWQNGKAHSCSLHTEGKEGKLAGAGDRRAAAGFGMTRIWLVWTCLRQKGSRIGSGDSVLFSECIFGVIPDLVAAAAYESVPTAVLPRGRSPKAGSYSSSSHDSFFGAGTSSSSISPAGSSNSLAPGGNTAVSKPFTLHILQHPADADATDADADADTLADAPAKSPANPAKLAQNSRMPSASAASGFKWATSGLRRWSMT